MKRTMHATHLRHAFRKIVAAGLVAPLPLMAVLACGGIAPVATEEDGAANGALGPCRPAEPPDAGGTSCKQSFFVPLTGDLNTCAFAEGGVGQREECAAFCGPLVSSCTFVSASVRCDMGRCAVDGRRYDGVDDRGAPYATSVGSYLARMAFFEAVSVDAFAILEGDLGRLGAPRSLVRSCAAARLDEARHTRMASRLAIEHGGEVVAPPPPAQRSRDLEALAIENAVCGCVGETFGVLVGMWQSITAPSAELRAFFAALVNDELRHAALSARIDAWARSALSPEARRRVDAARSRALAELETSLRESDPLHGLGLPSAAEALKLFHLWREGHSPLGATEGEARRAEAPRRARVAAVEAPRLS